MAFFDHLRQGGKRSGSSSPARYEDMVDIHVHILPGFDDGPDSMEESLAMLRLAEQDGITKLIATPHSAHLVHKSYGKSEIRATVADLQQQAGSLGMKVEVLPGIEVHLGADLEREFAEGKAFVLADSRYLLLELPFSTYPISSEQVVCDLRIRGLVPILAHPERLEYFQRDPALLKRLLRGGALTQVTAGSLNGDFGQRTRKFTEALLGQGAVHFLASDAHDSDYRRPKLSEARQAAAALMGEEQARLLTVDRPLAVTANAAIEVEEIEDPASKRRWF